MRRLVTIAFAALVLAGCANERTPPPNVSRAVAPDGFAGVTRPGFGITYERPRNWKPVLTSASLVGGATSNTATVAIWRYPRSESLPRGRQAFEEVQTLLLDRVRQRNPTFTLRESRFTRTAGARGLELVGSQTVAGFGYDVRSTHLFFNGIEYVVDAYAPSGDFARVDRQVFRPLLASLELTRP